MLTFGKNVSRQPQVPRSQGDVYSPCSVLMAVQHIHAPKDGFTRTSVGHYLAKKYAVLPTETLTTVFTRTVGKKTPQVRIFKISDERHRLIWFLTII